MKEAFERLRREEGWAQDITFGYILNSNAIPHTKNYHDFILYNIDQEIDYIVRLDRWIVVSMAMDTTVAKARTFDEFVGWLERIVRSKT
jgi:hypothetical protein